MKKIAFALLLSMPCGFAGAALTSDEKIYLNSKDVMVGNNGIYVNLDGVIVAVDDLNYDEQGINITPQSIKGDYFLKSSEACARCGGKKKKKKPDTSAQEVPVEPPAAPATN